MVADALVYHPAVSHYLKFVATTIGREKVLRTLQYFSRFYAWYLLRTNATTAELAPWSAMKTQFALIRKGMRLGKFVEHVKAASQAYDAKSSGMDPVLRWCAIARQVGYAGYMSLDHILFLHLAGIRKFSSAQRAKDWQVYAFRCWLAGILANSVAGVYQLVQIRARAARVNVKEGEGVVEKKRLERESAAVRLQLLSDVCDFTIPASGLGYAPGLLDDGIVGIAGTISSLIGTWSVWVKTA